MKKYLSIPTAMVLVCLSTALVAKGIAKTNSEDAKLRGLVPQILASWETFDMSKIEPYYAADADLTYFDLAPLKYDNWADYRAGVTKAIFDPNQSLKITPNDDLRIHRHGSLAWATFTFAADLVSKQGTPAHLNGRWTMIFEKRAQGWIVVHEHVSAPLGGS
ncbi:MAG TPA: nuclear transport factor 2 family protein [Candidatus Acidoferrales bacterium]|nr:nuclear transport factor 2 family protein [Candidatus Acidoferrales bacterium]